MPNPNPPATLQKLATGRTAEVYAWESGQIVKVYFPQFPRADAEYEADIATKVQAAGIACPRFYGLSEMANRPALVYERINGQPMAEIVQRQPWRTPQMARRMARLHRSLHQASSDSELPLQREKYRSRIEHNPRLDPHLKQTLLKRLDALPEARRICHGDFHPGNILCTPQRDLGIDWIDVSLGHPLADVARTSILLLGMAATIGNAFIVGIVRWFHSVYLENYFQPDEDRSVYRAYLPIVAAARLAEGITELEPWLLKQARTVQE